MGYAEETFLLSIFIFFYLFLVFFIYFFIFCLFGYFFPMAMLFILINVFLFPLLSWRRQRLCDYSRVNNYMLNKTMKVFVNASLQVYITVPQYYFLFYTFYNGFKAALFIKMFSTTFSHSANTILFTLLYVYICTYICTCMYAYFTISTTLLARTVPPASSPFFLSFELFRTSLVSYYVPT